MTETRQRLAAQPVLFLTVAEVARMVRVSPMTIYRMVNKGDLPAVRIGRSYRLPARAVREYLDEHGLGGEVPAWFSATVSATCP